MTNDKNDPMTPVTFSLPRSIANRLRKLARELADGNLSKLARTAFADFLKAIDGE